MKESIAIDQQSIISALRAAYRPTTPHPIPRRVVLERNQTSQHVSGLMYSGELLFAIIAPTKERVELRANDQLFVTDEP